MVTPWNISYKIVFEMILVGVSSAMLNKTICLAHGHAKPMFYDNQFQNIW
jgi:hypothetical protein